MADEEKPWHSFWEGFESYAHMTRFLITVGLFFILLTASCGILFGVLGLNVKTPTVQVSIAGNERSSGQISSLSLQNNGLSITLASGERFANLLVPANKIWMDSHILIHPGEFVKIISSGSANLSEQLSLNVSNDPASYDIRSFNFLVDPHGEPLNGRTTERRQADELRSPLKIRKDAPLGMLLATIVPDKRDLRNNPRAGDVVTLEEAEQGFVYKGNNSGFLFLTVNDLLISRRPQDRDIWLLKRTFAGDEANINEQRENVRRAYMTASSPDSDVDKQIAKMGSKWDAIVKQEYFEAFFEDNSGYFMVSIAVSSQQPR
jgi:hypothetical protein